MAEGHCHYLLAFAAAAMLGSAAASPRATCVEGQAFCSTDCKGVTLCIGNDQSVTPLTCPADTLCDAATLTCKPAADVTCYDQPVEDTYTCTQPGYFPSPFDCHRYFVCPSTGAVASATLCNPPYTAYDPLSTTCTLGNTSRPCIQGPLPRCQTVSQSGASPENPNIYFYCFPESATSKALVPNMYRCSNPGDVFSDGSCHPTTTTTTTTSSSVTTTTTTSGSTTTPRLCQTANTVLPDPQDCRGFYICDYLLNQIHSSCKNGYHFSASAGNCVQGTCTNPSTQV